MVERLADDRQVRATACHPCAECAPQVMKAHVFDASFLADGVPGSLGLDQMPLGPGAGKYEFAVACLEVCFACLEDFQRLRQQRDGLGLAVLCFGDQPFVADEVDLVPAHRQNVGAARTCDQTHLDVVTGHRVLAFLQSLEKSWEFFACQKARPFVFLVPSNTTAGVQSRIEFSANGLAKDAADQGQYTIGRDGVLFRDLVEDSLDFTDADFGQAALGEVDAVLPVRQVLGEFGQVLLVRLLSWLAVLLVVQLEHLAEGDLRTLLPFFVGRVAAQRHFAVVLDGLGPRFVHRQVGCAADLDALGAAIDLLIKNVGFDATGADANRQAGHFGVVVILPAGLRDRKIFDARFGEVEAVDGTGHGG